MDRPCKEKTNESEKVLTDANALPRASAVCEVPAFPNLEVGAKKTNNITSKDTVAEKSHLKQEKI